MAFFFHFNGSLVLKTSHLHLGADPPLVCGCN